MEKSHKIILSSTVILVAGYTWSLDMPLALEVPLREQPYNFSNFDFNLLYFATYIAIGFSDMPVGMLLDKLPIKKTILCICLISLLSEIGILLMFYFQFSGYKIFIYIFRGIFGITGEGMFTIMALLISQYGGKYYDMLIGVGICTPFLFDSINNILTPYLFDSTRSMQLVWGIGVAFCLLAFVASLVISNLVSKQQIKQKQNTQKLAIQPQEQKTQEQKIQEQEEGQLNFNGLKTMPREFWVIVGAVFFTQFVIACWIDNLNDLIVKRFRISYVNAGYLMFIPYGAGAFMSFILGLILGKKPKLRRVIMTSSTIYYSLGLLAMFLLPNVMQNQQPSFLHYSVIAIQFVSISYTLSILYGVLSSSIVYIVSPKNLGIGWGVIGSIIGLSQAIGPLIIAWILQSENELADGYKKVTLFTFFASLLAVAFSLWILCGQFQRIDVNSSDKIPQFNLEQSLLDSHSQDQIQNNQQNPTSYT